jgi:hypothetical protein
VPVLLLLPLLGVWACAAGTQGVRIRAAAAARWI